MIFIFIYIYIHNKNAELFSELVSAMGWAVLRSEGSFT